mmetsp:Transcript_106860/g.340323  ORF Transcript_106860/g.340323 Transcript_106860/m.340323 type:complete len:99 (-) Transcript_106860:736-1032(-)
MMHQITRMRTCRLIPVPEHRHGEAQSEVYEEEKQRAPQRLQIPEPALAAVLNSATSAAASPAARASASRATAAPTQALLPSNAALGLRLLRQSDRCPP